MKEELLNILSRISAEEQEILGGKGDIDRSLYMEGGGSQINARKLLASGKLITLRPHTRFIQFPPHSHDYVEMVYMCSGATIHIINGQRLELKAGELLLLNQSAVQEICRAGEGDVAVNFIILPQFFDICLGIIGDEETPLRRFLVDCLCGDNSGIGYLYFRVSQVQAVQNLAENLILTLLGSSGAKRKIAQVTMSLLFLELVNHTESLQYPEDEQAVAVQILRYIEREYARGSLAEAAEQLHYETSWLSRKIKEQTGKTFTQLVQDKRLAQAAFLLKNTRHRVSDIIVAVGYENASFFHRLFRETYGLSPKQYRDAREDSFLSK